MNNAQLEAMFRLYFTDDVAAGFVKALQLAYDNAAEMHDPDVGCNEQTFGFCTYHFGVFRLTEEFRATSIRTALIRNAFRLLIGPYEVGCYRVGRSEHDDIATCFPHNDRAAGGLVEAQIWLKGLSPNLGVEHAKKVIIGHLGNPDGGLRAVYMCVPGKKRNGRICEWAYTLPIWRADAAVMMPSDPALPGEERIGPPMIFLKDLPLPPQVEEVSPPDVALNPAAAEAADDEQR